MRRHSFLASEGRVPLEGWKVVLAYLQNSINKESDFRLLFFYWGCPLLRFIGKEASDIGSRSTRTPPRPQTPSTPKPKIPLCFILRFISCAALSYSIARAAGLSLLPT